FLGFGIHQTSLQIAPAVLFIAVYPILKSSIRTSTFWRRVVIYILGLFAIYIIFLNIGKSIHIPDLPKIMFAVGFLGILVYHLRGKVSTKVWLFALFLIGVAVSTHLFLYIRASHRPFINEGYPHNLKLFTDYILRRQYGVTSMFVRRATFFYQIKDQFLTYFSWQFFHTETLTQWLHAPKAFIQLLSNLIITFLGFGGAYYHFKKNKHSFAYFFSFMFMVSIAMVFVINLSDAEVRERDYFFTTAYNFWTVWMAIGSIALIDLVRKKGKILTGLLIMLVLALPVINLASQYFIHDRSREYIALDYGQNILNSVEENAIIFTNGDNDTFPVWYAQAVFDPAAKEYIPSTKIDYKDINGKLYQQITTPTEKTEALISKAIEYKNEQGRGIRKDVTIANLSLLNTPWYIKQLRDHEGVEFNLPERDIDLCQDDPRTALYPRRIPQETFLKITGTVKGDEFVVTFPKDVILYVKDLAVIQIIKDNYGKRPIYFAVTTPDPIGFNEFLRNEGMVSRLVPVRGKDQFDMERLVTNIDSVYSYRGILDDSIYKDTNMKRLLNNYGAAFMRTSRFAHSKNDYENAIKYMEKAIDFIDQKSRFYKGLSQIYAEASFNSFDSDEIEKGFSYLEKAVYYGRTDKNITQLIYQSAIYTNEIERGINLFEKIREYQDSVEIDSYIAQLKELQ
ncbi:MAG: membrane protein, partial [Candidatus Cloacimonetes bacterium]|nr:membrane protein [Candidatus Cloacimonadota bacterium]